MVQKYPHYSREGSNLGEQLSSWILPEYGSHQSPKHPVELANNKVFVENFERSMRDNSNRKGLKVVVCCYCSILGHLPFNFYLQKREQDYIRSCDHDKTDQPMVEMIEKEITRRD